MITLKIFATDIEEELTEGTVMELLNHNTIENRPKPKETPILLEKNDTPIDVISVKTTQQINVCELVSDTDQQFNDIND